MKIELVFQIAGIGILMGVLTSVLKNAGKEEMASLATLAGVVIVLGLVINVIGDLFQQVRSVFGLY